MGGGGSGGQGGQGGGGLTPALRAGCDMVSCQSAS